jgi:hypothetical protein
VYEKVGKAFADNDSVVIAKIDATANDIPDTKKFAVRFPSLEVLLHRCAETGRQGLRIAAVTTPVARSWLQPATLNCCWLPFRCLGSPP